MPIDCELKLDHVGTSSIRMERQRDIRGRELITITSQLATLVFVFLLARVLLGKGGRRGNWVSAIEACVCVCVSTRCTLTRCLAEAEKAKTKLSEKGKELKRSFYFCCSLEKLLAAVLRDMSASRRASKCLQRQMLFLTPFPAAMQQAEPSFFLGSEFFFLLRCIVFCVSHRRMT